MEGQPLDSPTGRVAAEFGYYPRPCNLDTDRFSVRTLTTLQESMAAVTEDPCTVKDWIYPGAQRHRDVFSGKTRLMPYAARVFGLPKTHVLTLHQSTNPLDLEFVVWCLAFFLGMPLTTTEAGFLDAAPTKPGKLVDFVLTGPGDESEAIGSPIGPGTPRRRRRRFRWFATTPSTRGSSLASRLDSRSMAAISWQQILATRRSRCRH